MKIDNAFMKGLEIREEELIYFPNGIIGFENLKKFLLVSNDSFQPFNFLVSSEQKEIAIPVINPFLLIKEYHKNLPGEFTRELGDLKNGFEVFCVVNPKNTEGSPTLNLKGPILIDYLKKHGKQIILTADILTVTYPLS